MTTIMETKFNFNSAICTSRSQSEHLLALGLKKETADMHYSLVKQAGYPEWDYFLMPSPITNDTFESIPAWSLHRLWELLGKINKYEGLDELLYPRISLEEEDVIFLSPKSTWSRRSFFSSKGAYENIINCFEELIKEGYFNKEYLCEK